jgi:hypothetical protein
MHVSEPLRIDIGLSVEQAAELLDAAFHDEDLFDRLSGGGRFPELGGEVEDGDVTAYRRRGLEHGYVMFRGRLLPTADGSALDGELVQTREPFSIWKLVIFVGLALLLTGSWLIANRPLFLAAAVAIVFLADQLRRRFNRANVEAELELLRYELEEAFESADGWPEALPAAEPERDDYEDSDTPEHEPERGTKPLERA